MKFKLTEDWLTVILGFAIIGAVLTGIMPTLPKFKWSTESEFAAMLEKYTQKTDQLLEKFAADPQNGALAPAQDLKTALATKDRTKVAKAAKVLSEKSKDAKDWAKTLSEEADPLPSKFSSQNLGRSAIIGLIFGLISSLGIAVLGGRVSLYVLAFPVLYLLIWASMVLAGNSTISLWGLEYAIWALLIGLFISNVFGIPGWLKEAVRTEFFIKIGLVIMGTTILFKEILKEGAPGLLQSVFVVVVVWYVGYWLARKMKIDDELSVMMATAVSICGVSAAIAACGAIQGDRKKLSYVASLVLLVALPMMILMPWLANSLHLSDKVAGAWVGGTIDTSGAVVAAGALINDAAMKTSVIVKFSQNVLIGLAAFMLSFWWAYRNRTSVHERPGARIIWDRFPKFVLGFLFASLVFSFLISPNLVKATSGSLKGLCTFWFALAFLSIGLETRFKELVAMGGGKPAVAFIATQVINILWTLALAYLLFGILFKV